MGRHSKPDGYDDPRDNGRRGSRDRRDAPDLGDIRDQRNTRGSREQPVLRDLRERRDPRERRIYPGSREPEERAEIRIARGSRDPRDPREPRYRMDPRDIGDGIETERNRHRDRIYSQRTRVPTEIAALADSRDAYQDRRDVEQIRYSQDTRRRSGEMVDPRHTGRSREDWDGRNLQDYRGNERNDQSSVRDDMVGQGPQRLESSQDSTPSPMRTRMITYFLPAEGISPEAIEADLSRYLGPEATWRFSTNREGVPGYLIAARRPPTSDMISGLMASSGRWQDERQRCSERPSRTAQAYRSDIVGNPEDLETISERTSSVRSRQREEHSIRRPSMAEYAPRRSLFDQPQRVDDRANRSDQEARDVHTGRSPGLTESSLSQSSTYDSPWGGTRATHQSRRSSYSTAASSVQSISDGRRRDLGHEVAQYQPRRASTSQYGSSIQGTPPASQSYTDHRTGERVTVVARAVAREMPAPGSRMQPDDDPPDWDQTPNFRELARGS